MPEDKLQTASNIDSFIDLYIINEEGNNVFDPEYQGLNNLEILIPKGRRFIKFYDPISFAPEGYIINSDYSVRIFLNLPPINKNYSYTYIRFNGGKIITIKTEFSISNPQSINHVTYGGGSIVKEKIWFNTKLIWESTSGTIIPCIEINLFN